jgi:hypothetical protein
MKPLRAFALLILVTASVSAAPPKKAEKAEGLVAQAQSDYVQGQYQSAIEKARSALKLRQKSIENRAWRIVGTASCALNDRAGAVEAWNHLDAAGRQLVTYVCKRNAIEVP